MDDEREFNWLSLFIKVIIVFIVIIIVIWLFSKLIRRKPNNDDFAINLSNMESAAVMYFKGIDLPIVEGKYIKVTLKELLEKEKLILQGDGSKCDKNKSFSIITRDKENYKLETTLKCKSKKETIKKDFSFDDCKNCKENNSLKEDTNKEESENNIESSKTLYYEQLKETVKYSRWGRGNLKGDNIENKYEYYSIEDAVYYTIGVVPKSQNSFVYTLKLDKVPNKDYYFTKIIELDYLNDDDIDNYLKENKYSLKDFSIKEYNHDNFKHSLKKDNIEYDIHPFYKNGEFFVQIRIKIINVNNVSSYYDNNLKKEAYLLPLKMNIRFASNKINSVKPEGKYEVIPYYRYKVVDKKTIWTKEEYIDGYKKTGRTQYR